MDDAPVVRRPGSVRPAAHPAGRHRRLAASPTSSTSARRRATCTSTSRATAGASRSTLHGFPRVDDIVGGRRWSTCSATARPAWSGRRLCPATRARPMRYVDLMGGQKPHLLVKTINNLGAETRVDYAPSTRFYLQDKRDGQALDHPAAVPGARGRAGRDHRPHQPQPLRHPLRLPPRLLRRRGARVPRLRHGRAVGHRGVRRLRRRACSASRALRSWPPNCTSRP